MGEILFTTRPSLGKGTCYSAHTTIAGRYIVLHHYYTDNYPSVAVLKATAVRDAPGILRAAHYSEEEIAAWEQEETADGRE